MRGDSGESLVEILLSVAILGVAVAALMFGMGSAATASGFRDRQAQQAETIRNYVDALQALPYDGCTPTHTPGYAPVVALPSGYTASATVIGYAAGASYPYPTGCPATGDEYAQQVRVDVSQADGRVVGEQLYVIKRKPCPASPC